MCPTEAEEEQLEDQPVEEIVLPRGTSGMAPSLEDEPGASRRASKHGSAALPLAQAPSHSHGLRHGPASVAFSTDADNGSLRPTSEDGELLLEDVALGSQDGHASAPRDIRYGGSTQPGSTVGASSSATSPTAMPPSPPFGRSIEYEGVGSLAMAPPKADSSGAGARSASGGVGAPYHSRLMQELTAGGTDDGDAENTIAESTAYASSNTSAAPSAGGSFTVSAAGLHGWLHAADHTVRGSI